MASINLNHISLSPKSTALSQLTPGWRIGQTLVAQAETDSDPRGAVTLRIGARRLYATSPLPVRAGDTLSLRVKTLGSTPVLQVLTAANALRNEAASHLRRILPRDGSLRPLLEGLSPRRTGNLPRQVTARLDDIRRALPTVDNLRAPGTLRRALLDSGTVFESRLAAASTAPATDLKGQLFRLRNEIRHALDAHRPPPDAAPRNLAALIELYRRGRITPARLAGVLRERLSPEQLQALIEALAALARGAAMSRPAGTLPEPVLVVLAMLRSAGDGKHGARTLLQWLRSQAALHDLSARVDSALNRIVTTQLAPLARDAAEHTLWLVDLPVQHREDNDEVHMRFERRAPGGNDDESWSVRLDFELAGLGRLQTDIRLQDGNINARFTTERSRTASGIREHLPVLADALAAAGLSVQRLEVGEGNPGREATADTDSPLLDERA